MATRPGVRVGGTEESWAEEDWKFELAHSILQAKRRFQCRRGESLGDPHDLMRGVARHCELQRSKHCNGSCENCSWRQTNLGLRRSQRKFIFKGLGPLYSGVSRIALLRQAADWRCRSVCSVIPGIWRREFVQSCREPHLHRPALRIRPRW